MSKFRYLIEISRDTNQLATSCDFFNWSDGVSKERVKTEFLKLKQLGIKPYALHIHRAESINNRFRRILLGGAK